MAKKKPSALEALARLNNERRLLEDRGAELKRAAALELGTVVLDAGGAAIGPAKLKEVTARIVAMGVDAALQRLAARSDTPKPAGKSKGSDEDPAEAHHG